MRDQYYLISSSWPTGSDDCERRRCKQHWRSHLWRLLHNIQMPTNRSQYVQPIQLHHQPRYLQAIDCSTLLSQIRNLQNETKLAHLRKPKPRCELLCSLQVARRYRLQTVMRLRRRRVWIISIRRRFGLIDSDDSGGEIVTNESSAAESPTANRHDVSRVLQNAFEPNIWKTGWAIKFREDVDAWAIRQKSNCSLIVIHD